jgi:hypothetical protein
MLIFRSVEVLCWTEYLNAIAPKITILISPGETGISAGVEVNST